MKHEKNILIGIGVFSILMCFNFLFLIQQSFEEIENLIKKKQIVIETPTQIGQKIELLATVKITAYPPEKKNTDSSPYTTAFNLPVRDGIVAVSKSLEKDFNLKYGDEIIIPSMGRFIVGDRMNQTKWTDYRVDIFMWCPKKCKEFGILNSPIVIVKNKI